MIRQKGFWIFVGLICVVVVGCDHKKTEALVELGDTRAKSYWVYLSGLTDTFDSVQEQGSRKTLDEIGHELGISFLAVKPQNRCAEFSNKLCWPHSSKEQVFETYNEILKNIGNRSIAGWIGFSNGGFFLNQLVQYVELGVPVISIGAAGYAHKKEFKNRLYLMIGRQDLDHYSLVKQLHEQAIGSALVTELIEYDGGHRIAKEPLRDLLGRI